MFDLRMKTQTTMPNFYKFFRTTNQVSVHSTITKTCSLSSNYSRMNGYKLVIVEWKQTWFSCEKVSLPFIPQWLSGTG